MNLELRIVQTIDDLIRAHTVRAIVFCSEQHVAYALEHDVHDISCLHILGVIGDEPAAAGRLRFTNRYAKLERIAVRRRFRGNGFGHRLTDFMIATAKDLGFTQYCLHAQIHLEDFYAGHGFQTVGQPFAEADIQHVLMIRKPKVGNWKLGGDATRLQVEREKLSIALERTFRSDTGQRNTQQT